MKLDKLNTFKYMRYGRQSRSLALPETSNIQERNNTHDPLSPGLTTPRSDTRKIYIIIQIDNC